MIQSFNDYSKYVNPYKPKFLYSIGIEDDFIKAKDCYLYNKHGQDYLDLVSGFGANNLGHNNDELIESVKIYLSEEQPIINPWGIPKEISYLSKKLISLTKNKLGKVYFSSTGSEAVESSLKFAMACTKRNKLISVKNGFHGLTMFSTQLTDNALWKDFLPNINLGIDYISINDIDSIKDLLETNDYAAIIIESIQGSSGSGVWTKEALKSLSDLSKNHGALLIIDEVMTGLGRIGHWFAYQSLYPGLVPDMIIVSKGLSGGITPNSAVLMTNSVYKGMFGGSAMGGRHGSTFSGNSFSAFCGLSVIDIIEKNGLLKNAIYSGKLFQKGLLDLKNKGFPIGEISIFGLSISFEIVNDPKNSISAQKACMDLVKNRVLTTIAPHNKEYIRITPPLNIKREDVFKFLEILNKTLC